jgi:plasmid stabilization system protein ParE
MSYKVYWTKEASITANKIVQYLRAEWTEKEVDSFLDKVDEIIEVIAINPRLFRASSKRQNIHLAIIKKRTILVYQVITHKKQIALLMFWFAKQNPKKFKY